MNLKEQVFDDVEYLYPYGLLRLFMSKEEIKMANLLVKEGKLSKGKGAEKNATVAYFKI